MVHHFNIKQSLKSNAINLMKVEKHYVPQAISQILFLSETLQY